MSSKHILDLNDDCLYQILLYFTIDELLTLGLIFLASIFLPQFFNNFFLLQNLFVHVFKILQKADIAVLNH